MKKQIVILAVIFATMMATVLTSCSDGNSYTRVTIFQKTDPSTIESLMLPPELLYQAKTPSGDVVTVEVEEAISLAKKIPYEAIMRKNVSAKYGFITLENQEGWFDMKKEKK